MHCVASLNNVETLLLMCEILYEFMEPYRSQEKEPYAYQLPDPQCMLIIIVVYRTFRAKHSVIIDDDDDDDDDNKNKNNNNNNTARVPKPEIHALKSHTELEAKSASVSI